MKCPKCGAKQFFTCAEDTKLEKTWKECFVCGFREENKMSEYKGINLTKINGIQEINFPKTMTDSVSVRLAFEKFDTKDLDEVGKCIQDHVEKLFQKQVEDTEMFIICEMAKMFLEEKEKRKRVVERLEEASFPHKFGGEVQMMILKNRVIEIVKEEGLN